MLSSLEEPDDKVAVAWATELERRSHEAAQGRVQTTAWETVRAEILRELGQRRSSNCILKRLPSFAVPPFGMTNAASG